MSLSYRLSYSSALLPTGTRVKLANPCDNVYTEPGNVIYIGQDIKRVLAFKSSGDLGGEWRLGTQHEVHHDQTLRRQGYFTVIGIVRIAEDGTVTTEGEIPTKALSLHVFK